MCITQGLDLVEFRSTTSFEHFREAGPPLAKLVDYKKLRDERRQVLGTAFKSSAETNCRREHQAAVERGRAAAGEGFCCLGRQEQAHLKVAPLFLKKLASCAVTSFKETKGRLWQTMGHRLEGRMPADRTLFRCCPWMDECIVSALRKERKGLHIAVPAYVSNQESSTGAASSSGLQEDRQESRAEALGHVGRQFQNHGSEASSLESTTAQMGNSSSSERDTGGRDRKGEPELGSRQAKKQRQQERQQQRGPAKKEKVKELFFGTKIAKHDIEVRLKKARQWLSDGLKHVSGAATDRSEWLSVNRVDLLKKARQ
eukprot:1154088-Pelagomonas_calceolata.AAC.13